MFPALHSLLRKKWPRILLATALLPGGLVAAGLWFAPSLLEVRSAPRPADVLVVLGGDTGQRALLAADLYHQGMVPRIIVSGHGDAEEKKSRLTAKGVPESVIELEADSTSTQENAAFTVRRLVESKAKRAVIVTSWFHSRRARNCFRHYAPGIEFISVSPAAAPSKSRWPGKELRGQILWEYAKSSWYWLRYGIRPF